MKPAAKSRFPWRVFSVAGFFYFGLAILSLKLAWLPGLAGRAQGASAFHSIENWLWSPLAMLIYGMLNIEPERAPWEFSVISGVTFGFLVASFVAWVNKPLEV